MEIRKILCSGLSPLSGVGKCKKSRPNAEKWVTTSERRPPRKKAGREEKSRRKKKTEKGWQKKTREKGFETRRPRESHYGRIKSTSINFHLSPSGYDIRVPDIFMAFYVPGGGAARTKNG